MNDQITYKNSAPVVVRIERIIRAEPHAVYRAWLDPRLVERWMAPGDLQVTRVEIEERVGGHYRIWQGHSGHEAGGFECELAELIPDQKIVFRWGFVGPERTAGPVFDSILTVSVEKATNGYTALTLVHEWQEQAARDMPGVAENVEMGWEMVIDTMVQVLSDGESSVKPTSGGDHA
jgi:uncharacterized protein YndB with AHSA1/START domain